MTITELSIKHGIEPEKAREFLREWLDMQDVIAYTSTGSIRNAKVFDDGILKVWKYFDEMYQDQASEVKQRSGYITEQVTLIASPNMEDL